MHGNLELLITITVALVAAFAGGWAARRVGLPSLVGYLVAGIAIGPFTPGFVGDGDTIRQLAEMGVIFMLFGVGLHFSLRDLWAVRRIAIPGAVLQMLIATALGVGLTQLWGWSLASSLVLGLAISIASTVVLLRGLVDNGLLNTRHGKVAVGWLVLEDLATIAILVLLPTLVDRGGGSPLWSAAVAVFRTALFAGIMLFAGAKALPWLLTRIAYTRSRELFILAVVALALGTALGAAELFGVSLALGAFLAGVVIGESDVGHQVGDEVLPFREIFAVLFFVSVGMLVDPRALLANIGQVLALTALIVVGKAVFTLLLGLVLPAPGRTMLVVAAGLSQIGEFSFIVGESGVALGILSSEQYGLLLAAALLSIVLNPLLFRAVPWAERALEQTGLWRLLNRHLPAPEPARLTLTDHVVVVGYGRVGEHIVDVLGRLAVPRLVIEADTARAAEFDRQGVPTLVGDASNSEVLTHADLERARALVVTLPDEAAAELVVAAARELAPELPIVARAATRSGVQRLALLGAQDVIHPELEGGLEVVRHTLLALGYPLLEVAEYTDAVRHDAYDTAINSHSEHLVLDRLLAAARGMQIAWRLVGDKSPLVGQSLAETDLRERSGASVIAIVREGDLLPNPKSNTAFAAGDMVGLIGDGTQIAAAESIIDPLPLQPEAPTQPSGDIALGDRVQAG